jgi:hypothetical protein
MRPRNEYIAPVFKLVWLYYTCTAELQLKLSKPPMDNLPEILIGEGVILIRGNFRHLTVIFFPPAKFPYCI